MIRMFIIGTALGSTGRLEPRRGDIDVFEREPMLNGIDGGYVEFNYHGWHQELLRRRITPDDVRWACDLLARFDAAQWRDAFRSGGYQASLAERFIQRLLTKINEGRQLVPTAGGG